VGVGEDLELSTFRTKQHTIEHVSETIPYKNYHKDEDKNMKKAEKQAAAKTIPKIEIDKHTWKM